MSFRIELSKVDRRLLFELSNNPRSTTVYLAKKTNMSRDQVQLRIDRFQDSGLIMRFHPLIPLDRFGLSHHITRLKLQVANEMEIKKLISFLVSSPIVTWVARFESHYDIGYAIRCKHVIEAADFKDLLLEKFHNLIIERVTGLYAGVELFSRDYLVDRKQRKERRANKFDSYKDLDQVDYKILESLSDNARKSVADITRDLISSGVVKAFTREAVAYRIQNLERTGWIRGSWVVLNPAYRNILYYKIDLRLKEISKEKLESFLSFCRSHPRVVTILKLLGPWDYEIDIELDDYKQGKEFIMSLTSSVPNVINNYNILMLDSIEKWGYGQVIGLHANT